MYVGACTCAGMCVRRPELSSSLALHFVDEGWSFHLPSELLSQGVLLLAGDSLLLSLTVCDDGRPSYPAGFCMGSGAVESLTLAHTCFPCGAISQCCSLAFTAHVHFVLL